MHLIGFSHHYTKMHGQVCGTLIYSRVLSEPESRILHNGSLTQAYDTEWRSIYDDIVHYAEIEEDEWIQLVFLGNKQIPFTTYRKFPKDWSVDIHGTPYADLWGKPFAFKFKGEDLPREFASRITADSVKIFD